MNQEMTLLNWENAFTLPMASCRAMCECGKIYYNTNGMWSWEDGELEELQTDENAYHVDYAVGVISFHGKEYANPCDCWKEQALKIIEFLESHREGIGKFFAEQKRDAEKDATKYPTNL